MAETLTKLTEAVVHEAAESLGLRINKLYRRLTFEEIDQRRWKGLCIFCDELETPDHYLRHKNSGILMLDCDDDQPPNDIELVETEVAIESSETEQRTVSHEATADMSLALLEEESIPQFPVSVSDSEILSNIKLRKETSTLETLEYVVMNENENLEQDGVQKYVSMKFEVDGDAERSQKVLSSTKNGCAHQVFGKMSQYKEKLGIKKKTKGFKSWMFKYKSVKGKIKKQDNQGWFHTWSRKVCWKKNKTTKLQFVLHVYEAMNHSTDSVPKPSLVHCMCLPLKHQVSNSYWKFSHRSPFESLDVYEDLFTIVRSHCSTSPFDLEYAANIARQVFDSLPLRIKLLQNLRKEMLSKTWWFKFKKLDVMQEDVKQVLLVFLPMDVIETRYAIGEHEKMFKMAKAISMISMIGLTLEIIENDAGLQARYELIVMVNERLLQTSLVIQQVMRNKKIKTSKRWWFKYKYVEEGMKKLHFELSYKCKLEFEEWFNQRYCLQETLRRYRLEWKIQKLECSKSSDLRTSKRSLLLLYSAHVDIKIRFSVWHCWRTKFKLCLIGLIDLLQKELLNHSHDQIVMKMNRRTFLSWTIKMHAYMRLFGINSCASNLGKRKLGKDWWFKYKTVTMVKDLLMNHQEEQLRIRQQRMIKLSQAWRLKSARRYFYPKLSVWRLQRNGGLEIW